MFIEIQVASENFLQILRNRILLSFPWSNASFQSGNTTFRIHQILFPDLPELFTFIKDFNVEDTTIQGKALGIKLRFEARITNDDWLEADINAPTNFPVNITVEIGVTTLHARGQKIILHLSLRSIILDDIINNLVSEDDIVTLKRSISDIASQYSNAIEFSLQDIVSTLPISNISLIKSGITTDTEVIKLLIQLRQDPNAVSRWDSFLNLRTSNHLPLENNKWAMIIDQLLLTSIINQTVRNNIGNGPKLKIRSNPSTTWKPSLIRFDTKVEVEQIDACVCLWGEIDVNADLTIKTTLQIPSDNIFRTNMTISQDAHDEEVICCAITAAALPFYVLAREIERGERSPEELLGLTFLGLLGSLGSAFLLVAIPVAVDNMEPLDRMTAPANCNRAGKNRQICDTSFKLKADFGGEIVLKNISGIAQGPVLGGDLIVAPEPLISQNINVKVNGFEWYIGGSCSKGYRITNFAEISLQSVSPGFFIIHDVEIINDPQGFYTFNIIQNIPGYFLLRINVEEEELQIQASYPCRILIYTSAGARLIVLQIPTAITTEKKTQLDRDLTRIRVDCKKNIQKIPEKLKVLWKPRPPSYFKEKYSQFAPKAKIHHQEFRLWQIVVSGLFPGAPVTLQNISGLIIAHSKANPSGAAYLSYLMPDTQLSEELDVLVDEKVSDQISVYTLQHALEKEMEINFGTEINSLNRSIDNRFIIETNKGTQAWMLTETGMITRDVTLEIETTDYSALQIEKKKYAWWQICRNQPEPDVKKIRKVIQKENICFILEEDRLWKSSLDKSGRLRTPDLVEKNNVVNIYEHHGHGLREGIMIHTKEGYEFVQYGIKKEILSTYKEKPWFINSVSFKTHFLSISNDRKKLELYRKYEVIED